MKSLLMTLHLMLILSQLMSAHILGDQLRPNVIVILTDDHGWADLGEQGIEQDLKTPYLDELAKGGLRATNGYVTAPQCVPSRAGLLSGRYQQRFGIESNAESTESFKQELTLAERLKQAGYKTGMSGKWHLGPEKEIVTHGFDDIYCTQGASPTQINGWTNYDLDGNTFAGRNISKEPGFHINVNSQAACTFINRHYQEPFFFYLAHRAPHTPLGAPQKYLDRFPGKMPERRRAALAMISAIDDGVGEILKTLRRHQIEENTLIFFMGDNGAPLKIHKVDNPLVGDPGGWDGSLNAPMNGEKGMLSEGGMRVPWLAYWKGKFPAGQVYKHPVISLDVVATSIAAVGLPEDKKLDGVNLLPYFMGDNKAAPHQELYWRWIAQAAVREGKYKLLVGGERKYLFDLEADPGETKNLILSQPELAQKLESKLNRWGSELQPPGIKTKGMAKTWEEYYDFYLDGKTKITK